jgi:hypothetical protein
MAGGPPLDGRRFAEGAIVCGAPEPRRSVPPETCARARRILAVRYTAPMDWLDDIKWDRDGLVPVIAQERGTATC